MTCGIYKITNNVNDKIYIGQSVNIEKRWKAHINYKIDSLIHRAILKYGVENFNFVVICEVPRSALNEYEISYIKYYETTNLEKGYNIQIGGNNEPRPQQTEEHKKKNSEALKINNPMFDPIVRNKWEVAIKSEEYREKQSISQSKRYENEEERIKQSLATKTAWTTAEYKEAFWAGFDTEEVREKRLISAKKQGTIIVFNGNEYYSKKELARQLGISSQLLNYRLQNNIPLDIKPFKGNKFNRA